MEIEKKRMLFLGIIIGAGIIAAIIFFLWGTTINRGTLSVIGDAPFRIEKIGGEIVDCPASPCELKLKSGTNDLIFHKEGYKSALLSPDVKLWRNTDFNVKFQIIPKVQIADRFPNREPEIKYELKDFSGRQALVKDNENLPIVYFPKPLRNPLIFGNEKHVLLIEEKKQLKATLYKVGVQAKKRSVVNFEDFSGALQGSLSPDGSYLVFWHDEEPSPFVLNTQNGEILNLNVRANMDLSSWAYDNSLIFVTNQEFRSNNTLGSYEGNYVDLLGSITERLGFIAYHPDENSYISLADFSFEEIGVNGMPELLVAGSNGQIVYFQSDGLKYKIQLRQF